MKKIIIFLFICSFMTSGFLYYYKLDTKEQIKDSTVIESTDLINKEEEDNEPITEDIEDVTNDIENESNNVHNIDKNDMESNNTSNSNVIKNKTVKQEQTNTQTNTQEPKKEVPKEQPKSETEWEKLGISEYDYYHKPMWSWARVDYSIEDYKTFEQTHQACIDAGNNMEDIINFSCTNINSYSGAYLGDMLKVKY